MRSQSWLPTVRGVFTHALSRRLARSAVIVVAAILGEGISMLLISPPNWGFAATLVGVTALASVAIDLIAWNRERHSGDH